MRGTHEGVYGAHAELNMHSAGTTHRTLTPERLSMPMVRKLHCQFGRCAWWISIVTVLNWAAPWMFLGAWTKSLASSVEHLPAGCLTKCSVILSSKPVQMKVLAY